MEREGALARQLVVACGCEKMESLGLYCAGDEGRFACDESVGLREKEATFPINARMLISMIVG
jgi:hypothetical protein